MTPYFKPTDGIRVTISADTRSILEAEQRFNRVDRLYAEIKLGTAGGCLLIIAGLVIKQLLGG